MNFSDLISNLHWLPVITMTIFSFVLGAVWHSSFLFGKAWKIENNPNNIQKKINAPLIFGGTAIMHFLAIAGLGIVVSGKGSMVGLETGAFVAFVWILPAMSGTYLFANRSIKLLLIDAGMYLVLFSICGLVLSIWQ
jgi:hypothetical protein